MINKSDYHIEDVADGAHRKQTITRLSDGRVVFEAIDYRRIDKNEIGFKNISEITKFFNEV